MIDQEKMAVILQQVVGTQYGDRFYPSISGVARSLNYYNAKEFILRFIMNDIEHKQLFFDSKTILQEIVQSQTEKPLAYELLREEGPDHNKIFESRALIGEEEIGRGTGRTKKAAEAVAAYHGILKLKKMEKERQA